MNNSCLWNGEEKNYWQNIDIGAAWKSREKKIVALLTHNNLVAVFTNY